MSGRELALAGFRFHRKFQRWPESNCTRSPVTEFPDAHRVKAVLSEDESKSLTIWDDGRDLPYERNFGRGGFDRTPALWRAYSMKHQE